MPVAEEVETKVRQLHQAGALDLAMTEGLSCYGPEIVGLLVSVLPSHEEACDVFGQACLDMWAGFPGFEWRSSFRTWSYAVARRAYLRHIGGAYRRKRTSLSDIPHLSALEARVRTQTRTYLRTDAKDRASRLRDQLTSEERILLTLRVDRDMSWLQIAEVMHSDSGAMTESEVRRETAAWRKRFERTKQRLKELAKRDGLLEGP